MNCERACELLERLRAVLADVLVAGELVFLPESSPVLPESSPSACCGGRPVAASIRASIGACRTRAADLRRIARRAELRTSCDCWTLPTPDVFRLQAKDSWDALGPSRLQSGRPVQPESRRPLVMQPCWASGSGRVGGLVRKSAVEKLEHT